MTINQTGTTWWYRRVPICHFNNRICVSHSLSCPQNATPSTHDSICRANPLPFLLSAIRCGMRFYRFLCVCWLEWWMIRKLFRMVNDEEIHFNLFNKGVANWRQRNYCRSGMLRPIEAFWDSVSTIETGRYRYFLFLCGSQFGGPVDPAPACGLHVCYLKFEWFLAFFIFCTMSF